MKVVKYWHPDTVPLVFVFEDKSLSFDETGFLNNVQSCVPREMRKHSSAKTNKVMNRIYFVMGLFA
jgi:hypothetical protein